MKQPRVPGVVKRFFAGPRYLARGLGMWATSPKLMFLGAIPALIVGAVFLAGAVVFVMNIDTIAGWLTPFADDWDDPFRIATRVVAGLAASVIVVYAGLFTFTALTLAAGDPFYERIWREVERRAGGAVPESPDNAWASVRRGLGNGIRLFSATAAIGVTLFVCGFIPVVGQIVVPVLGVVFGGWLLAVELSGFAFDARGLSLRQRRRMLGANRAGAVGFGMATYLLFLIPLGAVFAMPAAVAGATMLSRDVLQPEAAPTT
ncbi:MAG TPA: EI24 domain-containing protein [Homoserinimonas sp.]|nr:EI24 domain-containing protein [Homoserinimonas sp.]